MIHGLARDTGQSGVGWEKDKKKTQVLHLTSPDAPGGHLSWTPESCRAG